MRKDSGKSSGPILTLGCSREDWSRWRHWKVLGAEISFPELLQHTDGEGVLQAIVSTCVPLAGEINKSHTIKTCRQMLPSGNCVSLRQLMQGSRDRWRPAPMIPRHIRPSFLPLPPGSYNARPPNDWIFFTVSEALWRMNKWDHLSVRKNPQ